MYRTSIKQEKDHVNIILNIFISVEIMRKKKKPTPLEIVLCKTTVL